MGIVTLIAEALARISVFYFFNKGGPYLKKKAMSKSR
jgi:hypothetical protein